MIRIRCLLLFLLLPVLSAWAQFLPGQIIVDPKNSSYLVYNRDANKDGKLDPYFMIGPGDPEGFFYLGDRKSDGTRAGTRQTEIITKIENNGGNAIYLQVVRSHGGDGKADHNPWDDPKSPASGLNKNVMQQWRGWLDQMQAANIVVFLFIYDDGTRPFDDGGCSNNGDVSALENNFIKDLVNALESYPNLIWVIQEEFKFVNHAARSDIDRKPCTPERANRMKNLAALVRQYDDHQHVIGVHHNIGDEMHFANDPNIDMYVQQADTRNENLEKLHIDGVTGYDAKNRFVYVMAEAYDWHHKVMRKLDRTTLRRTYYATALAGGYQLVLGMFSDADPTDEMLQDMRRLQNFFEATNFNEMAPQDKLKDGDTHWVLATRGADYLILYSYQNPKNLGAKNIARGTYTLHWLDPVSGHTMVQNKVEVNGNASFEKPKEIGEEALLYVQKEMTPKK